MEAIEPPATLAGVIVPWARASERPSPNRLTETQGLVEALGCKGTFIRDEWLRKPSPSHLLSGGLLERLKEDIQIEPVSLMVIDHALSPVQQRNLERALEVKVIDRTGLILEIFGLRARTREGRLQVELARLMYERSRLVRTWTHLERQRGGGGFLSGPGETQLEADRRMLDTKVKRLRADLEAVRRTRRLQRQGRTRAGTPIIALVGYTNSGKSTLFNRLSGADVFAKDMPFATLDPTIRKIELPTLGPCALVDTVGFITDLPTHLIESFQATLEEATEADLLLHVRDRASADDLSQKEDVLSVLDQLEASSGHVRAPLIEVWNKSDLLAPDQRAAFETAALHERPPAVLVSAMSGYGITALKNAIEVALSQTSVDLRIELAPSEGAARAWLYTHADVRSEEINEAGVQLLDVRLSIAAKGRFQSAFPNLAEL